MSWIETKALQGLPAGRSMGIIPRGGAAGQDAPDGSAVICVNGGDWGSSSLQVSKMWSSDFLFTSRQINLLS